MRRDGYDKLGFSKEGYDKRGYDKYGYNAQGYDKSGYGELRCMSWVGGVGGTEGGGRVMD